MGGTFLGHGAQGFGGVLAAAAEQPGGLLGLQLLGQRAVGAVADQALGLGEGEGRAGGQARGEFADLGLQLVIGDHFADQASLIQALAGEPSTTTILIKGSRSAAMDKVVAALCASPEEKH